MASHLFISLYSLSYIIIISIQVHSNISLFTKKHTKSSILCSFFLSHTSKAFKRIVDNVFCNIFSITLDTEYYFFVLEKHFHLIYRTTLVLMPPPWPILLHFFYCFYYHFLNIYNLWCPRDHSLEFSFLYMNSYFR